MLQAICSLALQAGPVARTASPPSPSGPSAPNPRAAGAAGGVRQKSALRRAGISVGRFSTKWLRQAKELAPQ